MSETCNHPGCKHHRTHPCEGCGRQCGQEIGKSVSGFRMMEDMEDDSKRAANAEGDE